MVAKSLSCSFEPVRNVMEAPRRELSLVSGVVDVMDSIVPDGSPAFIGSHNQPGDEPL
jgi:hypothetical protein